MIFPFLVHFAVNALCTYLYWELNFKVDSDAFRLCRLLVVCRTFLFPIAIFAFYDAKVFFRGN